MKALSIRQPWAWLIVQGFQDIENRTWFTKFRGRVYVHAGKISDVDPAAHYSQTQNAILDCLSTTQQYAFLKARPWPLGAIVGEVEIIDCVQESPCPWFEGPYGFVLRNPVAYTEPIPFKGQLGFFDVALPVRGEIDGN